MKNPFNKTSNHFTNGNGVYIQSHVGHYLMTVRVGNQVKLSKVPCKGDAARFFPTWKNISSEKWQRETEAARAGWLEWHSELSLEYLFECDGKKYFTMKSDTMPAGRFFASQVAIDELKCGMSAKEQQDYRDAILEAVNKGDLARISVLIHEQNTRAKIGASADLICKFASIMIVEEGESIEGYDVDFNNRKIQMWKQHMGDNFFLNAPIRNILPFASTSEEEIKQRVEAAQEIAASSLLKAFLEKSKTTSTK